MYIPVFKICISKSLSNQLPVCTAEILAAITGLQWAEEVRPDREVKSTDSTVVLGSTRHNRDNLLIDIYHTLFQLHRGGSDAQFCSVLRLDQD